MGTGKATDGSATVAAAARASRRYRPRARSSAEGQTLAPFARLSWSASTAYAVGLIATDGCLLSDRRHIAFTSRDEQLVRTFLACLGRSQRYRTQRTRIGALVYQSDFSDVLLYDWLTSIGLSPRKSLTLGAIDVPDGFLFDLTRGLLDGDGTIANFTHAPTRAKYPEYRYERLWTLFTSASTTHLEWLRGRLSTSLGIDGYLRMSKPRPGRHDFFTLKYGNRDSNTLLQHLYADPSAPKLERKFAVWAAYRARPRSAEGGT